MGLLDGGLASVFSAALSGIYLDATLYRRVAGSDDGAGGGSGTGFEGGEDVKAQLDSTTQGQQRGEGYSDTDQRILVLASGVDAITIDDEIIVGDNRWAIASVTTDPAGAYFDLRGRRA